MARVTEEAMRELKADLLYSAELYQQVVQNRLLKARESVWIATANLKDVQVEQDGKFQPLLTVMSDLARRKVELKILHAELPSRPFRRTFDRLQRLVQGGLALKICPRVHFKAVLVDGSWAYLGSANLTGAGLGAKHPDKRNFELGFVTEDFEVIDRVTALFQAIWSGAECRTCRLRAICPDPIGPAEPTRKSPRAQSGIRLGKSRRLQIR